MPARVPREHEEGHVGDVRGEPVGVPDRRRPQRLEIARGADHLVMIGTETTGHCAGERALVVRRLLEADAERRQRDIDRLPHQRDHRARVDTAAQESAHRDVGDQVAAYGRLQRGSDLPGIGDRRTIGAAKVDIPVALEREHPALEREDVRRGKLAHAPEGRPRQGNEAEREIVVEGRQVEVERAESVREKRFDLGAEEEFAGGGIEVVVERLDPEPVPRREEPSSIRVPEGEREHALEPVDARVPPFGVRAQDHLGVAGGAEAMALRLQRPAQFPVVVDLAVVDDREVRALHLHRLAAGGREIDDAEAGVGEAQPRLHAERFVVGASMAKRIDHALHAGAVRGAAVEQDYAADAAHRVNASV